MPTPAGLPMASQRALPFTMFAVVWWNFGVMAPAYTTLMLCVGYIVLQLATPATAFTPTGSARLMAPEIAPVGVAPRSSEGCSPLPRRLKRARSRGRGGIAGEVLTPRGRVSGLLRQRTWSMRRQREAPSLVRDGWLFSEEPSWRRHCQ
jgi:hypothetical protein